MEIQSQQRPDSKELKLNQTVDPYLRTWRSMCVPHPQQRAVGERKAEERREPERSTSANLGYRRDSEIELLFNGEAPEWSKSVERPSMMHDVEVTRHEQ